ncbi:MAG: hypothetical protein ACJAYJ_003845 [Saprospiraceae bacterium]
MKPVDFKKDFQYHITKVTDEITIDGELKEATWSAAETGSDFWQKVPYFAQVADPKTEIKLAYDDKYLYVAAKCYQSEPITITTLKRDVYWDNDGIAIVLDPLNTRSTAVLFGTSAIGVQWDATSSATADVSSDWSNKWYVETQVTDEYWSAEFAIPFKILRYDPKLGEWGMNFVRNIKYCNEFHNWTAVPEGFWPPNAAFAGSLVWDTPPTKKTGNFNLIPYVTGRVSKSKDEDSEFIFEAGLDAKIALTSTLNLDLTLNPDFSQVEADELVTNLTRFNISLPEQRTFFLENADVFADFGTGGIRPFFSRRIGLNRNLAAVPILYGARATGNINQNNRIGIMNVHSRSSENSLAQNQSAVAFKRQFGRSFVQGLFLNRQAYEKTEAVENDYGRNVSVEGFYQSDNGEVTAWGGGHGSMKDGFSDKKMVYNTGFKYTNANWTFDSDFVMFQENYFADIGFTARVNNYDALRDTTIRAGFNSETVFLQYQKRPRSGKIQRHSIDIRNETIANSDWSFNESTTRLRYGMTLKNTAEMRASLSYNDISLLYPFSFTGDTPLPIDRYKTLTGDVSFESDGRKAISFNASAKTGGFYNGHLTSFEVGANYRIQPWGNFSVGYQWNNLKFPDPYGQSKITALISKIEIGFNKNLLWTTLFQYVDQSEYMGINSRIQWRFSPMSDVFLVYVDNYDVMDFGGADGVTSNNRAVILKVSYWY